MRLFILNIFLLHSPEIVLEDLSNFVFLITTFRIVTGVIGGGADRAVGPWPVALLRQTMAAYGVYGNGSCGGDVYAHGDDTDLYHQVVVLSKPDGSCVRSQANGSGVGGGGVGGGGHLCVGGAVTAETVNGRCNGEHPHQQQPYDSARGGGGTGTGGVGGGQRRHRRSFWCRTTTLATISALLATMFCVTCAVFIYYNCEYIIFKKKKKSDRITL